MPVELTKLENGLTVLSESRPDLLTASVGIWVDAGARHETPERHGISHMLEHMAFKGTARRTARAIAEEIEDVGGHLNAHTTHETTAYYARILGPDLPLAIDLLADILQHSTFDATELERERGVIIQEIGQALDTPDDLVFDHLLEATYPGQALGRPILGTVESVQSFRRDNLIAYMSDHYAAPSMVLSAVGAVDHDRLVDLASNAFGGLKTGRAPREETARFRAGDRRDDQDLEQIHLALAFEGVPYSDPDYYVAQLFASILGGGMSSRLFQEVREKRGLAYSVFSFAWSFADTGILGVYAGTDPDQVRELTPLLAEEMAKSATDINEQETARARSQFKAGLLMGLESSSARAEQMARQFMIFGRVLDMDEIVSRIDAVTAEDVRRFANRILQRGAPALAAVGPLAKLEPQADFAARF